MKRVWGLFCALLPAASAIGQGVLLFQNLGPGIDAPVLDLDGATRVAGTNYLAQLYAGPNASTIEPIGPPVAFSTNGYFFGGLRTLWNVPAGGAAVAQVRAWQASAGATFEDAVYSGSSRLGASSVFSIECGSTASSPGFLTGLRPFVFGTFWQFRYASLQFSNFGAGINAPIFDVDGVSKVSGTNYLAQFFAGSSASNLLPVGDPVPFSTNGYFLGSTVYFGYGVPVQPLQTVTAQVRVWRASDGATLEQAEATPGAHFGASKRFEFGTGLAWVVPAYLNQLQSFSLQTLTPASYTVQLANLGNGIDAPVFEVDGLTRLTGTNYVAQLYAGFDTNSLAAQGTLVPFESNGYFRSNTVKVTNLLPDADALVQVRVWRLSDGATFEEARTKAGAHWGVSVPLDVPLANLTAPSPLTGLRSFNLTTTPWLYLGAPTRMANGSFQWLASGIPGRLLIVESSSDSKTWLGFATNSIGSNGAVPFTDAATSTSRARFYRARMP